MRFYHSSKRLFCALILLLGGDALHGQSVSQTSGVSQERRGVTSKVDRNEILAKISDLQAQIDALRMQIDLASAPESATPGVAKPDLGQGKETAPPSQGSTAKTEMMLPPDQPRGINLLDDRVKIGGYGSVRFEANDTKGDNSIPGGAARGFTFRRFVLTTDSHLSDRIHIYTEIEFERLLELEVERKVQGAGQGLQFEQGLEGTNGGAVELEQAWAQFDLSKNHGFRFGVVLSPVGRYNIHHDDDYWDIPRRTLTDRDAPVLPVKAAWRELGAGVVGHGSLGVNGRIDYQVYLLGGATLDFTMNQITQTGRGQPGRLVSEAEVGLTSGAFDGTKSAQAVGYRIAYSPRLGSEIALSGYHGKYTPGFIPVSESIHVAGVDGTFKHKGFQVEGEVIVSSFGNVRNVLGSFAERAFASSIESQREGGQDLASEIEFSLEGLARRRYGFWTDIKYHWRPDFLKRTFLGRGFEDPVLIPIFRYERVSLRDLVTDLAFDQGVLTDLAQENRSQDRFTLGLSYRPVPSFAFQLAYEHNHRRSGSMLIFPALPLNSTNGVLAGMTFGF
jgi:hypothetical protein